MEVFVEAAQFINISLVNRILQAIDTKVVTKMVCKSKKVIVHPSSPVRRLLFISFPVMIIIVK